MTELNGLEPHMKCSPDAYACLLCGFEQATRRFKRLDGSYIVQCLNCGLLYVNPRPEPDKLDRHYRQSDPGYILNYKDQIEKRGRIILSRTSRFLRTGRLLDVGCGYGFFLAIAQNEGWQVKGIELSSAAASYAREKLGLDVFAGNLAEIALAEKSFDLISLQHTLEHIPDPIGMLKQLRNLLKEEGILVIAVPNSRSLLARLAAEKWIGFAEKTHIMHFTPQSLAYLLKTAGFMPVSTDTFQWHFPDLLWSAKIFIKKTCLPMSVSGTKNSKFTPENAADHEKKADDARHWTGNFNRFFTPLNWITGKLGLGAEIIVLAKKNLHETG